MGSRPVSVLGEYLTAQRLVWVRLAANRPEGEWQLSLLEVTLGEPPPSWRRQVWRYPRAVFIASRPTGATVARWLTRGRISLQGVSIGLALDDSAAVERRDSNFEGIYEKLPWPTHEWNIHTRDSSRQPLHDELVAADAPAFINFDHAAAAFFGTPPVPNRNVSGRELVARQQDRRARIDSVRVRPTELVVTVSGEQLRGTALTLSGRDGASMPLSSRRKEVRLPAPAGLGPGAWIALHRDEELLDRRILDPAWGGTDFDVELDASTRLGVLISGGETETVEFKRELPGSDPRGVMKTVAAFANGAGGSLLFGVEDDGSAAGLGDGYTRKTVDRLTNLITDWIRPLPNFELEMTEVAGAGVIAVNVAPAARRRTGLGPANATSAITSDEQERPSQPLRPMCAPSYRDDSRPQRCCSSLLGFDSRLSLARAASLASRCGRTLGCYVQQLPSRRLSVLGRASSRRA